MSYPRTRTKRLLPKLLAAALTCLSLQAAEEPREWTNTKGKTVTGTLKEKGDGWVKIEINKKLHQIPLDSLSAKDQEYVKKTEILKEFSMKVTTNSHPDGEFDFDIRTVELDLDGVRDRKLYLAVVWVHQLRSKGRAIIAREEEDFINKDGNHRYTSRYSNQKDHGEAYKGYALRILDQEGKTLAEAADPPAMMEHLEAAKMRNRPRPKK